VPDSGAVAVGDTLHPRARALNGHGDSVTASISWASLDTALVQVVDSTTGATLGKAHGLGRIQARVGNLRSNPLSVRVQNPLDSVRAGGNVRDTVHFAAGDSLSDSLVVGVYATPPDAVNFIGRRVVYAATIYPSTATAVTFVPRDSVLSAAGATFGTAVAQVRMRPGPPPDSAVVTATASTLVVTFVVEFRP
jgi:hypothetical protein